MNHSHTYYRFLFVRCFFPQFVNNILKEIVFAAIKDEEQLKNLNLMYKLQLGCKIAKATLKQQSSTLLVTFTGLLKKCRIHQGAWERIQPCLWVQTFYTLLYFLASFTSVDTGN